MASKTMTAAGSGGKQTPAATGQDKPGVVRRIRDFYDDVVTEMRKVSWPTFEELKSLTQLVLWSLLISGAVLGAYDFIFNNIMGWILKLG